ncbi:MAG: DUF6371 domain-containing protein [Bacteroidales bacterium]|jgi:hypothetical protein|nr:DUF6371 domain-containing protein [Bacteroidales bacterium]
MSLYKMPYLQPYKGASTRHVCPSCKTKQTFTLYLDGNTDQPIHPTVGKCNREIKCGYHYTPRQFFIDYPEKNNNQSKKRPTKSQPSISRTSNKYSRDEKQSTAPVNIGFIPYKYVKQSASYNSHFVRFLCDYFPKEKIQNVVEDYALGATKKKGVIFWQIDINGKIRTGKIMQYNPRTGKRIKNRSGAINWVHNKLKYNNPDYANFNLCQCYFGEHLLRLNPDKPVAIVEAEKTAIITSMIIPQYNWLATGNLNGLNIEKSRVLENRDIVLYPDAGCYEKWRKKMQQIKNEIFCHITISNLIEIHATLKQKEAGYDLADYIIEQLKSKKHLPHPTAQLSIQTQSTPQPNHQQNQQTQTKQNRSNPINTNQCKPDQSPQQHPFSPSLQNMISKNPALLSLINNLQLVES